jgi:hypothetical protein
MYVCYVGWADERKPNSLGRSLMLGFLSSAQPTGFVPIIIPGKYCNEKNQVARMPRSRIRGQRSAHLFYA